MKTKSEKMIETAKRAVARARKDAVRLDLQLSRQKQMLQDSQTETKFAVKALASIKATTSTTSLGPTTSPLRRSPLPN